MDAVMGGVLVVGGGKGEEALVGWKLLRQAGWEGSFGDKDTRRRGGDQ